MNFKIPIFKSKYKYVKVFTFRSVPIYLHWSCCVLLLLSMLTIIKIGLPFFSSIYCFFF